jgi:uncharacterized protein (UPF0332 family)
VSPRSTEFLDAARRRLAGAEAVARHDPSTALSAACYAVLYAARAALSEQETSARTHRGTWHEFRRRVVATGSFDKVLAERAQKLQPVREEVDYDARAATPEQAREAVCLAEEFVEAVARMLD